MRIEKVGMTPLSFGKKLEEHRSWGARVATDDNKKENSSFKIYVYPDTKGVVAGVIKPDGSKREYELQNKGKGVFEKTDIQKGEISPGDKYYYTIYKGSGEIDTVKDPYTFKQEKLIGDSTIYDQSAFRWQNDAAWKNNPNRISRTSNGRGKNLSVKDARIYALNPDSFTDKRSYEGVKDKLKEIKEMGFNTVEIMHVENTYSYNWGYDGVDKMAASDYLGGPDKLKELVDEAHKEGLNVVFDIIPNHLGPDGAQLKRTGPYIKGPNAFGEAFNFEGENSEYVRDYIINSAMNWIENYHVDGLRLDMTKYMESDLTLKQMAAEINYHYPDAFLIAEDGRGGISVDDNGNYWANNEEVHDKRVVNPLRPEEYGRGKSEEEHTKAIQDIINGKTNLSRLGMDSEWDFNYYHQLDSILYAPNTSNLLKAALNAQQSVKYVKSHDEIGNYEGTRAISKLMVPKLRLNDSMSLSQRDIERARDYAKQKGKSFEEAIYIVTCQKAQLASEDLAIKYQTGELDKYEVTPDMSREEAQKQRDRLQVRVLSPLGINSSSKINFNRIKKAFNDSIAQNKMALALTYSIPGPKMTFQGDEDADLTPFRFFRQFESVPYEEYLYTEKGYEPGMDALSESTLGKINYSEKGKERMEQFAALTKDLNKLNEENHAIRLGHIDNSTTVDHGMSQVVAFSTKDDVSNNEIFTITNAGETNYREDKDNEYWIKFPKGRWVEVLNTDDEKYGGTSRHLNKDEIIHGDGSTNRAINLAGYSTICFKRVG